ncbi:MAG TPA: LppX_LprAFG lipoprotein [Candidatus Acidoferrum sp.]|nr:LppX_LprAFG lipoprotein [Candidatus Acidoferrum sp.]
MKHLLVSVGSALLLCACGAAQAETPQQVVSTASDKMSGLHSAKFDLTASVLEQFPPAFTQSLGAQGAALSNLSLDMSGKGQAKFPDQASMSIQLKTGSISISTDMVFSGSKVFIKDPQTGNYSESSAGNALSEFTNQTDPLSGATVLKAVQSIKDLGDTTVNGTAVHHYQITPDKNKLADQASTQQAKDLLRSMLQTGTIRIEVWIGKDDHLLHRLRDDTDANIDLNQVLQASGQQMPPGFTIPPGTTVHAVVHATIDYHDFNASVTVTVPPTAS